MNASSPSKGCDAVTLTECPVFGIQCFLRRVLVVTLRCSFLFWAYWLGLLILLNACTGQERTVEITAQEFRFVPHAIELVEGQRVRLALRNQGNEIHTFQAPFLRSQDVRWISPEPSLQAGKAIVLRPGERVEFSLQPRAGVYPFRCWIKGHAGMEGVVIVKAGKD